MGIRTFMYPACGRPRAKGYRLRGSFTNMLRRISANSISGTREVTRSIETMEMEHSRMSATRLELRWAAGRGLLTFGILITMGTLISMWRTDICPALRKKIWQVFFGGKSSRNHLRMPRLRWGTNADGMQSTNWYGRTTPGTDTRGM